MVERLAATARGAPRPVQEVSPDVPRELVRIISSCLSRDRAARYASSVELLAELRGVAQAVGRAEGQAVPSVAVLPFANLSADAETDYFADGMATEIITVRERMIAVMDALRAREAIEFEQIFRLEEESPPSRTMIVVTFLAILELVRLSTLRVYQGAGKDGTPEGPIHLRLADGGRDSAWEGRISEIL